MTKKRKAFGRCLTKQSVVAVIKSDEDVELKNRKLDMMRKGKDVCITPAARKYAQKIWRELWE